MKPDKKPPHARTGLNQPVTPNQRPKVLQTKFASPPPVPSHSPFRPGPNPALAKTSVTKNPLAAPKAPPVYRPQPTPKVLQTKKINSPVLSPAKVMPVRPGSESIRISKPPAVSRPNGLIQRAASGAGRPSFSAASKQSAYHYHNVMSESASFEVDVKKPRLPSHNAAMPHRMSFKDIRDNVLKFHEGEEDKKDFLRWTGRFVDAGEERIEEIEEEIRKEKKKGKTARLEELEELLECARASHDAFVDARREFSREELRLALFMKQINSFHANVPDLGPHKGVNNPVRERAHLHFREAARGRGRSRRDRRRSLSPMSRRVAEMSPERLSSGVAVTEDEDYISTTGEAIDPKDISARSKKLLAKQETSVVFSFDPDAKFS